MFKNFGLFCSNKVVLELQESESGQKNSMWYYAIKYLKKIKTFIVFYNGYNGATGHVRS